MLAVSVPHQTLDVGKAPLTHAHLLRVGAVQAAAMTRTSTAEDTATRPAVVPSVEEVESALALEAL